MGWTFLVRVEMLEQWRERAVEAEARLSEAHLEVEHLRAEISDLSMVLYASEKLLLLRLGEYAEAPQVEAAVRQVARHREQHPGVQALVLAPSEAARWRLIQHVDPLAHQDIGFDVVDAGFITTLISASLGGTYV